MEQKLLRAAADAGVTLTPEMCAAMRRYWEYLLRVNETMNLTRVTSEGEAITRHFADSLAPLGMGLIPPDAHVIDIGSGAGFPGIPLAIARPDIRVTMLDSLGKRVSFLNDVAAMLGLNAVAVHGRAEEYALKERESFDIATARAVARMNVLAEWALPFVKVGGRLLAYKGPAAAEELPEAQTAFKRLGGDAGRVIETPVQSHTLIIVHKVARTPKSFPRRPGEATRAPL